jgi:hypothetical protein
MRWYTILILWIYGCSTLYINGRMVWFTSEYWLGFIWYGVKKNIMIMIYNELLYLIWNLNDNK